MTYVGQCDRVRRRGASDEERWQAMMRCARPVSLARFLERIDITPIIDEDETPESFIADARRADPSTAAFRSFWGTEPCWFLSSAGFEYIFLGEP